MPNFKLVFQFTQPSKGWSEVYYRTATDVRAASVLSQSFIDSMRNFRANITTLIKVRVSDVLNNRSSVVVPINQVGGPTPGLTADITASAAVVTLNAPLVGSSRKVWLRGLPDTYITRDLTSGIDTPDPRLLSGINNFLNQLAVSAFTVRALAKIGVPPNVFTTLISVTSVAGAGTITLNFAAGPTFAIGTQINITQVSQKLFPGLKGTFTIVSSTVTTAVIAYNALTTGTSLLTRGRIRPVNYLFGNIDFQTSNFSNFGTRATGKNPLGGRGAKRGTRGLRSA
jgi:hypothetical protein